MSSPTEEALKNAAEALEKALQDVKDGKILSSRHNQESLETTPPPIDQDDPDAMAEAFLAQQALKNERQNRLEVEEWAEVISKVDVSKKKSGSDSTVLNERRRDALEKTLIQQLSREFEKAWEEAP